MSKSLKSYHGAFGLFKEHDANFTQHSSIGSKEKMFLILYNKLSVAKYHPQHRTGGEKTFATINLPQTINQSARTRVQRRTKGLICTHAT
jgi:hypothetical protein